MIREPAPGSALYRAVEGEGRRRTVSVSSDRRVMGPLAAAVIIVLGSLLGCRATREPAAVSPELIGVWATDDVRYAERRFELTAETVTLATGESRQTSYRVQTLAQTSGARGTAYVLTCADPGEGIADTLSFVYEAADGGTIRFRNQNSIVWKKVPKP